ncbi:Zinc knuckle family protein [Aphelenchoides avenae]|nr:Zinc knuckle family protein [Aphelenchus avenae]
MLGNQSTSFAFRQDGRYQNTNEDRPVELQQRFPHSVQASSTPLHDEYPRQDQLYAQSRAHHYTTYASAVIPAAVTHSTVTVSSPTAPTVSQPPARYEARDFYNSEVASYAAQTLFEPTNAARPTGHRRAAVLPPAQRSVPTCASVFEARSCTSCREQPRYTNEAARHQQASELLHRQQSAAHRDQPMHYAAAGGRGSSSAPPVGPVDNHAVDDDYEARSAFYRHATFHRAAPGSAPSPLVLTVLPIVPFDGDVRRYPTFRNRFLDVVEGHPELAPRHKLQYLLQFLRGEPSQLANNFELTDANYYTVVDSLEERYGDKHQLRRLLAQDIIAMRPPANRVADLRRFHDEAFRITTELRTLGVPIDEAVLFEQTLMGKLPPKLKEEIVRNTKYCRERTVSSTLDGLREYARILDEVSTNGNLFAPDAPAVPAPPSQEPRHSTPSRSSSDGSTDDSTELSEDASAEQPTVCVSKAVITDLIKLVKGRWRCQLCSDPHAAANCTTYATVNRRLRRAQKLRLCLHCLSEGHRADSCPRGGMDLCQICHKGNHHRALCMAVANGTGSGPLRCSSKCATSGSTIDCKRFVPKRHARTSLEEPTDTILVAAARKLRRSGTHRSPAIIADDPNKRHAPVKNAVHRSETRKSVSTAPRTVPSSAPRQDRENKPRASPARKNKPRASPRTQGQSGNGTNSTKTYRKKKSGNAGTSSKGRESTTRPSTTSTDESKQKGVAAYDWERRLAALETFFATASCSTKYDLPRFDRPAADLPKSSPFEWDPFGDEPWEEDNSSTQSTGGCSDVMSELPDANSEDDNRFPTCKEVRAYVASASTTDAQAPLHECLKVTAVNPAIGATRKVIVFFDSGSTFSYISPSLARDLDLPHLGKSVLRVSTFGSPAPTTVEGFSTSVTLCSPQGLQVPLDATTADLAIPSVRTALVENSDLPLLRRNERNVSPTEVAPDILIGQDRIHLFARHHGSRLPAGCEVVHTILGPTIGGAPQAAITPPKAVPCSSAAHAEDVTEQHLGSPRHLQSGMADASPLQTITSSSTMPSIHVPAEKRKPKPDPAPLAEKGLGNPTLKADNHPCLQNQLQGDTTSTTLRAERHLLPERTRRSELLRRKPNPLDTAHPSQSGPHTIYAVLQQELRPSLQLSAQRDGSLRPSVYPPTRPTDTAPATLNARPRPPVHASPTSLDVQRKSICSAILVSDHKAIADVTHNQKVHLELRDGDPAAVPTERYHLHRDTGDEMHSTTSANVTTAADAPSQKTPRTSHLVPLTSSDDTAYSETAPLAVKESGAEVAVSSTPDAAYDTQEMPTPSGPAPLAGEDGDTARASSCSAPLATAASEGAPPSVQPPVVNKQHETAAVLCASSDKDPLRVLPPPTPAASAVRSSSSPCTDTERRFLIDDLVRNLLALYGRTPFHELPSELIMHLPDAADPHYDALLDSILQYAMRKAVTQLVDNHPALLKNLPKPLSIEAPPITAGDKRCASRTQAIPALAHTALVPAARADPSDQENSAAYVMPSASPNFDIAQNLASLPTSTTRCSPFSVPALVTADNPPFSAARPTTSSAPTTDQRTSVGLRLPAEAVLEPAAPSQGDIIRVRTIPNDSPLKNETVCFCDEPTFLYFGRLLRSEVLMITTPTQSHEDALLSVCDIHLTADVRRIIFWFSGSHTTPLTPAVQLRLVTGLCRYYATHYPTVTQYVVATPSICSRQDVWTYGLFKMLVQMQVMLPHARLIMCPRKSQSVTHAEVAALKSYLRDHHHLNLWSRYDADDPHAVEASRSSRMPQQHHVMRAVCSADPSTAGVPCPAQSGEQRRTTPNKADATPKVGPTNAAPRVRPACRSGKTGSRQLLAVRDDYAVPRIAQFPPPPSRSRFFSTPLTLPLRVQSDRRRSKPAPLAVREPLDAQRTCSTPLVGSGQATKRQSTHSKPAPLAVREATKTRSCEEKKEQLHRRSTGKQAPGAPADASLQESSQRTTRRPAICAFCALPHWATKCTIYRSTAHRIRRARGLGFCFVCLRIGHEAQSCPSQPTSPCHLCKQGQHHRALCPLPSSIVGSAKQMQPQKPGRPARSTEVPAAVQTSPPPRTTEAYQRRQTRKRKNREPRK